MLILGFVLWKQTERFQPEFLRKEGVDKTLSVEDSSYSQVTNHMNHAPYSMGPIAGTETPFRVNMFTSYVE